MTERERVLDMLARVHSGDPWHGPSVMASLDGIDAARASAHPLAGTRSIWEIAQHVIAWRREVTARLRGKAPSTPAAGDCARARHGRAMPGPRRKPRSTPRIASWWPRSPIWLMPRSSTRWDNRATRRLAQA